MKIIIKENLCQNNTDREKIEKGYHALACVIWFNKNISIHSNFEDLDISSLEFINIVVTIEDTFDIEFDPDSLLSDVFQNISGMVKYVQMLINRK